MRAETSPVDRAELTSRIDSLAARVEGLLSQARPAGAGGASSSGLGLPADLSDYALPDQISYLRSALSQRSAEAEEWMNADRAARDLLAESRAELSRERAARERAEAAVERLTLELEELTRLLIEVEEREARKIADGKAEAVAELEDRIHGMERALADERIRTDQYRDVAERMQSLAVYQSRELALLRDRLGETEGRVEGQTRDLNKLTADYRKMRQTISWRATAPIRKFFKALRKLLRGQPQSSAS